MTSRSLFHYGAIASLIALILLSLAWELLLAPLRPGGSFLALKAVVLLLPLMGILKGRVYTYQWSSMFILAFFTEGVMRGWGDSGLSQRLAWLEVALTVAFFACVVLFVRSVRIENTRAAARR
ncbi:DUF2069 domain-containing protein [Crenobacter luteus]|uniref:DUF2069 domain-containing protein n=1 Tax=Crenobacter luteus TaxID=1452487 RepID=A0A165FHQ5_9NEIS|nr:DUF2069 domain-containing protein [Crenobacter luteus]KZE33312.1 hypothetical protein AVW16_09120 [Crenobacter luteus]